MKASTFGIIEEKKEDIMKAQELENEGYKNDKKAPEANCMRTLRTCEEQKINRETCANVSAKKRMLARDERINSTKLSEIINKEINNSIKEINNSIKDAMQTIVKQYSMVSRMQVSTLGIFHTFLLRCFIFF